MEKKIIPVKFGPRKSDVDVAGRKYSELPGILATIHDTEIPENVEIFANDNPVTNLDDPISDDINSIDLTAVAGQKQG